MAMVGLVRHGSSYSQPSRLSHLSAHAMVSSKWTLPAALGAAPFTRPYSDYIVPSRLSSALSRLPTKPNQHPPNCLATGHLVPWAD